jgi:hypothetical protein
MSPDAASKRGRPLKFGRHAQLVTLTLPDDVIQWLGTIHRDLGWAVVKLHERAARGAKSRQPKLADLVQLPGQRALILVTPEPFKHVKDVSVIPLADGRGFLALAPGKGAAELELAVLDRLDAPAIEAQERAALMKFRALLKQWRQEGIDFESRSIILARVGVSRGRALSPLRTDPPGN